jgi:molybdopterin-binding protein
MIANFLRFYTIMASEKSKQHSRQSSHCEDLPAGRMRRSAFYGFGGSRYDFGGTLMKRKSAKQRQLREEFLTPREAALQLRISFPTIKQWIYARKVRSVKTPGGHHRIPQSEVDRLLFRTRAKTGPERQDLIRRVSGRNQLVGRIEDVRISGLMAEVTLSIGNQRITSIITSRSAREMQLKAGQAAAALIKATEVMILRV